MRLRIATPLVMTATLLLLACSTSQLTTAKPPGVDSGTSPLLVGLSFEELVDQSDWIVIGTVMGQESKWNADHTNIHTLVTISVEEWLKGKPFTTSKDGKYSSNPLSCQISDRLVVTTLGGSVGDIAQHVEDVPQFETGEQVLLFLNLGLGNVVAVVGGIQGEFTITNGNAVPATLSGDSMPLAELISRIKAQLAK